MTVSRSLSKKYYSLKPLQTNRIYQKAWKKQKKNKIKLKCIDNKYTIINIINIINIPFTLRSYSSLEQDAAANHYRNTTPRKLRWNDRIIMQRTNRINYGRAEYLRSFIARTSDPCAQYRGINPETCNCCVFVCHTWSCADASHLSDRVMTTSWNSDTRQA